MPRDYTLRLDDIRECCEKIARYTAGYDYDQFAADQLLIDAVVRNLEIIGEASSHVPESVRGQFPNIPWGRIVGFRNFSAHEYFDLDPRIVWSIVETRVPELHRALGER